MSKISFAIGLGLWLSSGTLHAAAVDIDGPKMRAAVQKSVDLLQKTGPIFVKKGACTSATTNRRRRWRSPWLARRDSVWTSG